MKILLIILFAINTILLSQSFTKITEGSIVTDGGYSFGASWSDFNNDGYPDLYVTNGGADGRSDINFLYMNNGDGTFTKITEGDPVTIASKSIGSTIVDFDNDNDADIFIANRNGENNLLFANNGDGSFSSVQKINVVTMGGNTNGSSWTDINLDGYPDLYAANFFSTPFLYVNNQNGTFDNFSNGLPTTKASNSISVLWGDYDNDGDPDLFIPNASSGGKTNLFYINNGGTSFSLINSSPVITDLRASMGGTWGDFNNDGYLDLFVANQDNFENDLYINEGDGSLKPVKGIPLVSEKSLSISGSFVDIDNDGDLDLYVTNWQVNNNFLYINSGYPDYNLEKNTATVLTEDKLSSMAAAWADYDNDGDLDLFVANRSDLDNQLFRNENSSNNWVEFSAVGSQSGTNALVTKFRLLAEINGQNIWQMREINAQHGYNSQNDMRVHFGLGNATQIDTLVIEWTSGLKETLTDVPINQIHQVFEGSGITSVSDDIIENEIPDLFNLSQNYPNPFNPSTKIKFTIPQIAESALSNNKTKLTVYNQLGQKVAVIFNEQKPSGSYEIIFNAEDLPSGVYIYRLTNGSYSSSQKMILLK